MGILNYLKYRISLALRALNRSRYRLFKVHVGKNVNISWGAYIDTCYPNSIIIGDGSQITRHSKLIAHDAAIYRLAPLSIDDGKGYIHLGRNVFVGVGSIILRNVTIGENSIIAAGSVVKEDVPANVVVSGNPAKIVKSFKVRHDWKG